MPDDTQFPVGSSSIPTSTILTQLENAQRRNAFVAESVRVRLALLIRALREQREWSQADLGQRMGKPQPNISKFEDPDYGKYSLATLLEFAATYELPLYIDMPEWDDWFRMMSDQSQGALERKSFDRQHLSALREQERSMRALQQIWAPENEAPQPILIRDDKSALGWTTVNLTRGTGTSIVIETSGVAPAPSKPISVVGSDGEYDVRTGVGD